MLLRFTLADQINSDYRSNKIYLFITTYVTDFTNIEIMIGFSDVWPTGTLQGMKIIVRSRE